MILRVVGVRILVPGARPLAYSVLSFRGSDAFRDQSRRPSGGRPSSPRTEAERGRSPSEPKRKGSPPLAWVSIGVEALRSPSERDPPLSLGLAFTPSPLPLFPLGERERRGGQPHPPQEGVPTRPCPQQGDIPRRHIGLSHTPPGSAVYAQQGTAGIYCEGKPPGQRY